MLFLYCVCHAFASVHCCFWSPAGKGLAFWLSFVVLNCVFVTFLCGILGQVWYLIVSIADLCPLLLLPYHKRLPLKERISSHVGGNSSP